MPWASAASAFCSLGMSTLWEALNVRCIYHIGFSSLSRGILLPTTASSQWTAQANSVQSSLQWCSLWKVKLDFFWIFVLYPLNSFLICLLLFSWMFSLPRVPCCSNPLLEEFELSSAEMFPCWLPWCGAPGCVGWWIDGGMSQVTVESCLPVSCSDSSYGLTSFSSCQFLENT